ncbi:MAG: ABC transporter ATP-binding protein [Syntrophales bacterium]|jgi:branched-chain amino acid transport system ATP-binding protein|nr:ABC transporter ATP-binding protein [Syntrophales bacterium]
MAGEILSVSGLEAGYDKKTVVFGIDFEIPRGSILGIIGHNGAGKSTTLKAVSGLIKPFKGEVIYKGENIAGLSCAVRAQKGLTMIPSEHFTFATMTVLDNLLLGGRMVDSKEVLKIRMEKCYDLFPILAERSHQKAGTLSGGEQRMLSIAIILMAQPGLLLLDEPSLGLAPAVANDIMAVIKHLVQEDGLSVLFVEQNLPLALKFADNIYIMRSGRFILNETVENMSKRERLWDLF